MLSREDELRDLLRLCSYALYTPDSIACWVSCGLLSPYEFCMFFVCSGFEEWKCTKLTISFSRHFFWVMSCHYFIVFFFGFVLFLLHSRFLNFLKFLAFFFDILSVNPSFLRFPLVFSVVVRRSVFFCWFSVDFWLSSCVVVPVQCC